MANIEEQEDGYRCKQCEQIFDTERGAKMHYSQTHLTEEKVAEALGSGLRKVSEISSYLDESEEKVVDVIQVSDRFHLFIENGEQQVDEIFLGEE